jgi:cytochrome oxidase Cu insertion factor (SCO1/SenC/PrrC family)
MKKILFFLIVSCVYIQLKAQEKTTRITHSGDIYDIYANEQIGKKITSFSLIDKNGREINSVELRKKHWSLCFGI